MVKTTLLKAAFVAVIALQGACIDPLSVEQRPCPCDDGYFCCSLTNQCLQRGQTCAAFAVTADHAVVRQGGDAKLTITGPELSELIQVQVGELQIPGMILPRNGLFEVPIGIPHGAPLGPYDLRFTARRGGKLYQSPLVTGVITVSPIGVSQGGDDQGPGTTEQPFQTLEKAISRLGEGDTLQVAAGVKSIGDGRPIALPDRVILTGESIPGDSWRASVPLTLVRGQILPKGNLVIRELALDGRVVVTGQGSVLSLEDVQAEGTDVGVRVDPEAVGAWVMIKGRLTRIVSRYQVPVKIQASDVHLRINNVGEITNLDVLAAVALDGNDVDLTISESSISTAGGNAIYGFMRAKVLLDKNVIHGIVNLEGPGTVANIIATTFNMASFTRAAGGLRFRGDTLTVTDCMFHLVSLLQGNSESRVTVRNTTFSNYVEPAVSLEAGDLDLGNEMEPGENKFENGYNSAGPAPVAVNVRARTGAASVTIRESRVNGRLPPAGMVMGPAKDAPFYQIENMVPIRMY